MNFIAQHWAKHAKPKIAHTTWVHSYRVHRSRPKPSVLVKVRRVVWVGSDQKGWDKVVLNCWWCSVCLSGWLGGCVHFVQIHQAVHVSWALSCIYAAAAAAKSLQLCPTLCDPIDGSPPGSPVPGSLQARTLEWVAISFSNSCIYIYIYIYNAN